MHVVALGVTLPVLALAARPVDAQSLSPQEVFRRVSPSVVVIEVTDDNDKVIASGSGVVIPNRSEYGTLIATNCHVVDQAPEGVVTLLQGEDIGLGEVNGRDASRDLCTIHALIVDSFDGDEPTFKKLPAAQVGSSQWLEVGDSVYAVGAPRGLELTLSNGLVSGFREHKGNEYIQTTAPISKGSSGGGLFDAQGRLVGITTMYVKDGQALNFAVPAELIASVPEFQPTRKSASKSPARQSPPLTNAPGDDSRWMYVTKNEDGGVVNLDRRTARRSVQDVTAWAKTTYESPKTDRVGDTYDEYSALYMFHCSTYQLSTLRIAQRLRGKVVYSRDYKNYEVQKRAVEPDTIGEALLEAACSL